MVNQLTESDLDELIPEWLLLHAVPTATDRTELEIGVGRIAYRVTQHYTVEVKQPEVLYEGPSKFEALFAYNGVYVYAGTAPA